MGLGGFLASKAELDHYHYLRKQTHARVERSCAGEMEREVHSILGPLGVHENLSRLLAENLRTAENGDVDEGVEGVDMVGSEETTSSATAVATEARQGWFAGLTGRSKGVEEEEGTKLKWTDSVGLTAFLLKFGEGLGEYPCFWF